MSKARDLADSVAAGSVLADGVVSLSEVGGGTNNGVVFVNGSGTTTSGSALTFDGSTLDVTGTVVADEFEISAPIVNMYLMESDTTGLNTVLRSNGGNFTVQTVSDSKGTFTPRLRIENANGNVAFYEDTGTTPKFFWDASAESLGIGTSVPQEPLHVSGSGGVSALIEGTTRAGLKLKGSFSGTTDIGNINVFNASDVNTFRISVTSSDTATPNSSATFDVSNSGVATELMKLSSTAGVVFNEDGNDVDFRIESDTDSYAFFLEGATGNVGIGTSGAAVRLHVLDRASSGLDQVGSFVGGTANTSGAGAFIGIGNSTGTTRGVRIAGINTSGSTGAHDMVLYTNVASTAPEERVRITSDGAVGIGTSSPSRTLHVNAGSTDIVALFESSDSPASISFYDGTGGTNINSAGNEIYFRTGSTATGSGGTERLRITPTGVGIGTDSPSTILEIKKLSDATLRLNYGEINSNDGEDYYGGVEFYAEGSTYLRPAVSAYIRAIHTRAGTGHSNSDAGLVFGTSNTTANANAVERMRIEANTGAVLVGGTSTASAHVLDTSGSLFLQSQTNDANIGLSIYVNEGVNNRRASFFVDDSLGVYGVESSASTGVPDFVIRRGGSEIARFTEDGLTFNGDTAAANALDDYEEGSWTPVVADAGSGGNEAPSYTNQYGTYTKIGRLVTITVDLININSTGLTDSNDLFIRNLPFSVYSVTGGHQFSSIVSYASWGVEGELVAAVIPDNNNTIRFSDPTVTGTTVYYNCSRLDGSATDLRFSLTYFAA